jgi:hypothetical protein
MGPFFLGHPLFSIKNFSYIELSTNHETTVEENEYPDSSIDNTTTKQNRQRSKRQTATDSIPLVEFHDALSRSTTFGSDTEQHS